MTMYYGNKIEKTWSSYIEVTSISTQNAYVDVKINYGIHFYKKHNHETKYESFKDVASNANTVTPSSLTIPIGSYNKSAGTNLKFGSQTYRFNRKTSAFSGYIKIGIKHSGSGSQWKGTSVASVTTNIPAKPKYSISYKENLPSNVEGDPVVVLFPVDGSKWYGDTYKLDDIVPNIETDNRYSFTAWNTSADGTGTSYSPSQSYSGNSALTLYAQWNPDYPPFCTTDITTDGAGITGKKIGENGILGFCGLTVNCSNIATYNDGTNDKEIASMSIVIGSTTVMTKSTDFTQIDHDDVGTYYDDVTLTALASDLVTAGVTSGTYPVYVVVTDDEGVSSPINVGTITLVAPTWQKDVEVHTLPPQVVNGNAVLDLVQVWNYQLDTPDYETVSGTFPITVVSDDPDDPLWTFPYVFDADHVDDKTAEEPNIKVKVSFKHYDTYEKEYRKAFFNTTRNQNYSNGIYNVMFIGGVVDNPNYTSRVWWSQINNPKYFPDTNYSEVGSNDTAIVGLTKVGDYLACVKQSKTTDTAIYLLYPTSFEEETTFAIKQGVQGVGALARYSFNILGDETLFLSPKGVMAIVPSQDEEHKVQNRSYYIDGRLLKESNLEESYSFVFDGKYYLAVNGVVYVLDGNQRNSWGNDRTNLVYECYFLDNVPARCFVKFNDQLVFSSYDEVCIVGDGYEDAYLVEDREITEVPVKAEWSTVFDDDGSLHYYKTMQKKGNLVSILPRENETPYKQVYIDADEFNANKTLYFTFNGEMYVRCTESSTYEPDTEYFIENRSHTKVSVRKNDKPEVEIERSFGLSSDIPSEMFLRKKFKKYKRLQFIIRNEEAEPFGVDSIVKNYTVGNYAKK